MRITEWEPDRRIGVERNSGGISAHSVITMEPLEGGKTRLSRSTQAEIGGLLRLIQPFITRRAKREHASEIDHVKRLLESPSPAPDEGPLA